VRKAGLRIGRRASPPKAAPRIVGLLRAVPIRWRILSIAALNSAVVVVLGRPDLERRQGARLGLG